jgi:hypothetical protein
VLWNALVNAFQKNRQLHRGQVDFALFGGRPNKTLTFKSFSKQKDSMVIPSYDLVKITTPPKECK